AAPPLDSATATANGGLQRSAYEAPATSPAGESSPAGSANLTPVAPETTPAASPASDAAAAAAPALAAYSLRRDLMECEQLVAENKFRAALAKLTPHYANADLTVEQRALLHSWLDALAAKVIYSREHLLASPHQVRRGQDLYQIAHEYNVEYRLL